ncbi:hypothetical protein, variant [Cladophialophora immunda]|uniref:Uncharacterized protein n=1 Tax=Cladophialophora immunda TaxID=569365 RepID=A0A0D2AZS9_9EURO|nr:uncharacterized protein PV07_02502 [Cladophialophora immunda]XP_016251018.1 hypothetical protein, variant [Cladophialophora immunda]KIW30801.1 hypothetical protein PV07_02502 [Cladophialophora immunda]KIW30802.1 hypothetical protein, variant [Cladophialophora immunda]
MRSTFSSEDALGCPSLLTVAAVVIETTTTTTTTTRRCRCWAFRRERLLCLGVSRDIGGWQRSRVTRTSNVGGMAAWDIHAPYVAKLIDTVVFTDMSNALACAVDGIAICLAAMSPREGKKKIRIQRVRRTEEGETTRATMPPRCRMPCTYGSEGATDASIPEKGNGQGIKK